MRVTFRTRGLNMSALLAAGLALAAVAAPARAELLDFTFSFSNSIGTTAGTVTGEIEGLADNSTGAAGDVIIESAPAMENDSELGAPYDTASWTKIYDSFTVTDGQITAVDFRAATNGAAGLSLDVNGLDNFTVSENIQSVTTFGGFAAITFTPLNAPASPEPGTFAMAALALPALGSWAWKKRQAGGVK